MTLEELNGLERAVAEEELLRSCGSWDWARQMVGARPFASEEAVHAAADRIWSGVDRTARLEAFRAHPRIGARVAQGWSSDEQSGARVATAETLEALARANDEYFDRFGFIFIVCATGKTADDMLHLLRQRLSNAPDREIEIAADEQRKIMHLRLRKLLT